MKPHDYGKLDKVNPHVPMRSTTCLEEKKLPIIIIIKEQWPFFFFDNLEQGSTHLQSEEQRSYITEPYQSNYVTTTA